VFTRAAGGLRWAGIGPKCSRTAGARRSSPVDGKLGWFPAQSGLAREDRAPIHRSPSKVSENIKNVGDADFEAEVLKSEAPVLVDFWAEWCGPCKAIGPIVDQVASDYAGRLKVVKVNIDNNPGTPRQYAVRGIPTLMLFKDGKVAATQVGAVNRSQLTQFVDKAI
jgi:thioredoxin 1